LRVVSSNKVIHQVLGKSLGGSQRKEGTSNGSTADIVEGQDGVWLSQNQIPVQSIWRVFEFGNDGAVWRVLTGIGIITVRDIWVVQVLDEIFKLGSDILNFVGQILVPLQKRRDINTKYLNQTKKNIKIVILP
jgi:hypothetical protein